MGPKLGMLMSHEGANVLMILMIHVVCVVVDSSTGNMAHSKGNSSVIGTVLGRDVVVNGMNVVMIHAIETVVRANLTVIALRMAVIWLEMLWIVVMMLL